MAVTVNGLGSIGGGNGLTTETETIAPSVSGATLSNVDCFVVKNGNIVMLQMKFVSSVNIPYVTKIGTLPDGYLPPRKMRLWQESMAEPYEGITVYPNGDIEFVYSNSYSPFRSIDVYGMYICA